jgi:hypothetical protein
VKFSVVVPVLIDKDIFKEIVARVRANEPFTISYKNWWYRRDSSTGIL